MIDRLKAVRNFRNTKEKTLAKLLVPSLHGIVICMICLVSLSWAWFTTSVTSGGSTIKAGNFSADVIVTKDSDPSGNVQVTPGNGEGVSYLQFGSDARGLYKVEIKNTGSVSGYCIIKIGSITVIMDKIEVNGIKTCNFVLPAATSVQIYPSWGEYGNHPSTLSLDVLMGHDGCIVSGNDLLTIDIEEVRALLQSEITVTSGDASSGDVNQSSATTGDTSSDTKKPDVSNNE